MAQPRLSRGDRKGKPYLFSERKGKVSWAKAVDINAINFNIPLEISQGSWKWGVWNLKVWAEEISVRVVKIGRYLMSCD